MGEVSSPGGIVSNAKFVESLATECRVDAIKVEDFILAMRDLIAEALREGKSVTIKHLGQFCRLATRERPRSGQNTPEPTIR